MFRVSLAVVLVWVMVVPVLIVRGAVFYPPTANRALFEPAGEERFFVGTLGKPWVSGTFGCVRSGGMQLHEGVDIKALQHDRHGESTDPVIAVAEGTVVYISDRPGLSNYGRYVVVRHHMDGLELYSLYAHLREIRRGLAVGQALKAGENIGVLGRSANTSQGISKERAHLHFELNLLVNDRFSSWFKTASPGQRNDHGSWNGQNLLGIDPVPLLRQLETGRPLNMVVHIQQQPVLCRVMVRETSFPWLIRYAVLGRDNTAARNEGIAGYELALNYQGIPIAFIPRSSAEMQGKSRFSLVWVNESEQRKHPCRRLVAKRGDTWRLTAQGERLLELICHR